MFQEKHRLSFIGKEKHRNGLGIVERKMKENAVDIKRLCDKIIGTQFVLPNNRSAGAPQVGLEKHIKKEFENMDIIIQGIPICEKLIIEGYLHDHLYINNINYDECTEVLSRVLGMKELRIFSISLPHMI